MGAEGAVNIIMRKQIEEADDPDAKRAELVAALQGDHRPVHRGGQRDDRRRDRSAGDAAGRHSGAGDGGEQAGGAAVEEAWGDAGLSSGDGSRVTGGGAHCGLAWLIRPFSGRAIVVEPLVRPRRDPAARLGSEQPVLRLVQRAARDRSGSGADRAASSGPIPSAMFAPIESTARISWMPDRPATRRCGHVATGRCSSSRRARPLACTHLDRETRAGHMSHRGAGRRKSRPRHPSPAHPPPGEAHEPLRRPRRHHQLASPAPSPTATSARRSRTRPRSTPQRRKRVVDEGAAMIHIHARTPDGVPSLRDRGFPGDHRGDPRRCR